MGCYGSFMTAIAHPMSTQRVIYYKTILHEFNYE